MLILHARTQPRAGQAVNLAGILATLRQDPATRARAIGPEADPEAVAATLTEDQIEGVVRTLGDSVRVVDDTAIGQ